MTEVIESDINAKLSKPEQRGESFTENFTNGKKEFLLYQWL